MKLTCNHNQGGSHIAKKRMKFMLYRCLYMPCLEEKADAFNKYNKNLINLNVVITTCYLQEAA